MGYSNAVGNVLGVISKVREQYYPELSDAVIVSLFQLKKNWTRGGKSINASICPIRDKERALGIDGDLLIVISKEAWDASSEENRYALIDHELAHAVRIVKKDGSIVYRIVAHDVEEFVDVVKRRGLWNGSLRYFTEVVFEQEKALMGVPKEEVISDEVCEDV